MIRADSASHSKLQRGGSQVVEGDHFQARQGHTPSNHAQGRFDDGQNSSVANTETAAQRKQSSEKYPGTTASRSRKEIIQQPGSSSTAHSNSNNNGGTSTASEAQAPRGNKSTNSASATGGSTAAQSNSTAQNNNNQSSNSQQVQHQYSAHYTGGESTSNKRPQEMSALDRLKCIQNNFRQTWHGINCEISGRPGTANFVNRRRTVNVIETVEAENERQKLLQKLFVKLKELEDERNGTSNGNNMSQASSTNRSSMSGNQPGFFSQAAASNTASNGFYNNSNKNQSDFLHFKNITDKQMVSGSLPYNGYQKSYHIENSELLYKMIRFDNKLCRSMLEQHGFSSTDSHEWNLLWSSSSCKSYQYEGLNEYQKINHFPQSYEITRKDRLCFNIVRMQERFGKAAFDFSPDTYILPDEFGDFYNHYQKLKQHESKKNVWIVKPANACQGRGIYIVDDINDVNVDETSVICKYITNPLLINGHKFDLRIYVLVTSYEPMKIYVYQEGLARFASETYTQKINKNNKYMHLTNYSINKKNERFIQNENSEQDDFGYKWSLGAFCKHLEQVGIDMNLLWSRIYDVILKTLLCGENYVQAALKKNGTHRTNCFELFGFDILIDSDLKPWLIEVNLSPSMAGESPLDMSIKSNLLCDTFNLIGLKRFDRKKESINKIKHRMKGLYGKGKKNGLGQGIQGTSLQPSHGNNGQGGDQFANSTNQLHHMIEKLALDNPQEYSILVDPLKKASTLRFKEHMREAVSEYQRRGHYIRIYPAKNSDIYDQFFNNARPYNRTLYKVLFTDEILKSTISSSSRPEIKMKMDMPMSAYEQYKKQQQDRAAAKKEEEQKNVKRAQASRPITGSGQSKPTSANGATASSKDFQSEKQSSSQSAQISTQSQSATNASSKDVSKVGGAQMTGQNNSSTNASATAQSTGAASSTSQSTTNQQERVLITGDDILIEYVDRLMNEIKNVSDSELKTSWKTQIEKFITHYVWHSQDPVASDKIKHGQRYQTPYWVRLQGRLNEMQERRRRLIKYLYKKEGKLHEFESGFQQSIAKKSTIIKKFSSIQLEDLLRTSTKNVAQEVVSSLIPPQGGLGVLADVQQTELTPAKINSGDSRGGVMGQSPATGGLRSAGAPQGSRRNQNISNSQGRQQNTSATTEPPQGTNTNPNTELYHVDQSQMQQTPNTTSSSQQQQQAAQAGLMPQSAARQMKTASGSRSSKGTGNASYNLTAQNRAIASSSNEQTQQHFGGGNEDSSLPQMPAGRVQNLSGTTKRMARIN